MKIYNATKDGNFLTYNTSMPKYYIISGQIKEIIDRQSHRDAILYIIKKYKGKGLITVTKICVSETGWSTNLTCYETDSFLKEIQ